MDKLRNVHLKYFTLDEFDSPDDLGSGENMELEFLLRLDKCRGLAGIPFKINSGYRTQNHNKKIGGDKNSSHTNILCNAVDISATTSVERFKIIQAALSGGFTRIGIGKNFVHLDTDLNKSQNIIWHYY
jgi:uncharacterized protein YcbK (DUF882 family)